MWMGHMGHMDHIHSEQLIKLRCDAREIDIIIPNYTHGLQFYHLMILMVLRSPAPIFPFPASISYRILIHLFMIIYDYLCIFMYIYVNLCRFLTFEAADLLLLNSSEIPPRILVVT